MSDIEATQEEKEEKGEEVRKALNAEAAKLEVEPAPVATAAAESPKPKADELKIVIILKDTRAMIGVQSPDCDPVYETMDGDLSAVLTRVPQTVEIARSKWVTSKRNPKADLPAPPKPAEKPATTAARKPTAAKAAAAPAQRNFF